MTIIDEPARGDWVPDACTLPTAERPFRVAEFDVVFADHLRSVERQNPIRAILALVGPEGLSGRVRDLVSRENDCCRFFSFGVAAITRPDGTVDVRLKVAVRPSRRDVLSAFVARAEKAAHL